MKSYFILQVSDIHISGQRAYNYLNWTSALEFINSSSADLVVFSGDQVLDDPDIEEDHAYVCEQLSKINKEWRAIPGNHDIGDSKPKPFMGQNVNQERLARYQRHLGADRWLYRLGEWQIIGINSLLLDSGLPAEEEQYRWLEEILQKDDTLPTALFLHKPLFIDFFDEGLLSHWCVTPTGRQRLWELLKKANVQLVACGHTHHFRTMVYDGITMVWAPAVGHIDFEDTVPFSPLTLSGIVRYRFDRNGVEFGLVIPEGMETWNAAKTIRSHGSLRSAPLLSPTEALARKEEKKKAS